MGRGTSVAGSAFSRQSSLSTTRPPPAYTRPPRSDQYEDGDPGPSTRPFSRQFSRLPSSFSPDQKERPFSRSSSKSIRPGFSADHKSRPLSVRRSSSIQPPIPLVPLSRSPSLHPPPTPRPPIRRNPYANMTQDELDTAREELYQRHKKRTCCAPGDFCYDTTLRCFWPLFAFVAACIVTGAMLGGFYRPKASDPCPIPHTTLIPVPTNVVDPLADSSVVRNSAGFMVERLDLALWVNGTRIDIERIMESVGVGPPSPTKTVSSHGGRAVGMALVVAFLAMVVVSCLIWIGGWVAGKRVRKSQGSVKAEDMR